MNEPLADDIVRILGSMDTEICDRAKEVSDPRSSNYVRLRALRELSEMTALRQEIMEHDTKAKNSREDLIGRASRQVSLAAELRVGRKDRPC